MFNTIKNIKLFLSFSWPYPMSFKESIVRPNGPILCTCAHCAHWGKQRSSKVNTRLMFPVITF